MSGGYTQDRIDDEVDRIVEWIREQSDIAFETAEAPIAGSALARIADEIERRTYRDGWRVD